MQLLQTIPILRIFDVAKAKEFYLDYLGFRADWEHRFEPGLPLYTQISIFLRGERPAGVPRRARAEGLPLRFNEDL